MSRCSRVVPLAWLNRSWAGQQILGRSTDPGQGVSDKHVYDPGAPEGRDEHDDARRLRADLAYLDRLGPRRMASESLERTGGLLRRHHRDEPALVGDVQRIDP